MSLAAHGYNILQSSPWQTFLGQGLATSPSVVVHKLFILLFKQSPQNGLAGHWWTVVDMLPNPALEAIHDNFPFFTPSPTLDFVTSLNVC